MSSPGSAPDTARRSQVRSWVLYDCGATAVNAIVVTFVFSVYLTNAVGEGLPGDTSPSSWLGRALTVAGVIVALLAPITGIWVDAPHRRRRALALLTGAVVMLVASMSLIGTDYTYLWAGLALLAITAACNDLATVPYNAMLSQLSTPATSGRISGAGLAVGYGGSVGLLLIVYALFISGDGGLLGLPTDDGQNVRAAMLLTAAWFVVFALPLVFKGPNPPADAAHRPIGIIASYRKLWHEVRSEWRRDRNVVYYLVASAVFRDGLTGVFTFGAVLGVNVYGISPASVLLFGVCACLVAALGAVVGGLLDDRFGAKPVILGALSLMIVVGLTLMTLSGQLAFWVCGLLLCLFIGPTLSAARTQMLRMSTEGKEGVAFGLYMTTGRAAAPLAPWLFFLFIDAFGTDRAGMGGLCAVLGLGLILMLGVKTPRVSAR
ncbi:MFS transporter, UMF1 family [Mycolicibacterium neoaurum]|uniref:MFS transporter n=1 Tax=Mycolicibacterium neoaurum TaxID=1795 RepID=UPI000567AFBC|nr:MFS transporter [Mycolicibacterium neoaurum]SDD57260.1 MFS transporter, UMF1 family [Mycolicibacterium neoaurum]